MSKKSFIDSVEVKSPCTEDWSQMQGNQRVRFCSHCSKSVNNLSEMTRKEAIRLVRASNGNLCIRYVANPVTKRPLFADQLLQITRRTPSFAAGVMTASIALSSHAWAQGGVAPDVSVVIGQKIVEQEAAALPLEKEFTKTGSISGVVKDQNGAVIPGIAIELINKSNGEKRGSASDADGIFKFDDLTGGSYRILFKAAMGFAEKQMDNVQVTAEMETIANADMTIGAMGLVVVGDVAFSQETEYKTPLVIAVRNEEIDQVRELIANGANVNGKEEDKSTPLFAAVESGNIEIVQLLLDQGANVNARDKEKQTPLMSLDEDATPELVALLVAYAAKLDLADKEGNTALILAARRVKSEVIKAMIDAGADVKKANKDGLTALMNAADNSDIESVRLLMLAGADVNAKNKEGETAWDKTGNSEIEELLVSHGAIIEVEPETETSGDQPEN